MSDLSLPTAPTHFERHRTAENAIMDSRPDFVEATALLAALEEALKRRYDDWTDHMPEVEEAFKELNEVLAEADRLQGPSDEH